MTLDIGSKLILQIQKKTNRTTGNKGTYYLYVHAPHTQNPQNPSLPRFEVFPNAQTFYGKPEPLYSTQYSDLFVTYTNDFNLQTGQPNPQSIINESGKIVKNKSKNKFIFPALNVLKTFAIIDYNANVNTKIDYAINHVFRSMTVLELNTLHIVCELETNNTCNVSTKPSVCWIPPTWKPQ